MKLYSRVTQNSQNGENDGKGWVWRSQSEDAFFGDTKLSQWKILGQKVWSFVRGQSEATFFNDTKLSEWKTLGQKVKVKLPSSMTKHSRNAKDLDERGGVFEK